MSNPPSPVLQADSDIRSHDHAWDITNDVRLQGCPHEDDPSPRYRKATPIRTTSAAKLVWRSNIICHSLLFLSIIICHSVLFLRQDATRNTITSASSLDLRKLYQSVGMLSASLCAWKDKMAQDLNSIMIVYSLLGSASSFGRPR